MATQRYDSGTARVKFRDMLEASRRGIDIIIEHYKRNRKRNWMTCALAGAPKRYMRNGSATRTLRVLMRKLGLK